MSKLWSDTQVYTHKIEGAQLLQAYRYLYFYLKVKLELLKRDPLLWLPFLALEQVHVEPGVESRVVCHSKNGYVKW
jgi:hypothetical protein